MSAHAQNLEAIALRAAHAADEAMGTDDWPELDAAADAAFAAFSAAHWGV